MSAQIEDIPLALPPAGITANFTNPESRASTVYITAGIWACALGFISGSAYICITIAVVNLGAYGHHIWDFTISGLSTELIRLTLVNEVVYGPFIFFIKLTLFLLLLEIFGRLRWLKWLVWIGICVTALFYLATMVVYIVLCAPHGGQSQLDFLAAISSPQCESQSLSVVTGGFNIVSDLYILLTPFPAVWSLQMPRRRKIGISAIFLTGIAACISSILGLVYRLQLSRSTDNTWTVIPLWAVTITEVTSGFLVSCMPSAAAVYRHAMPGMSSLLSNYYQRFRGYGISDTAFELRESNNTSDTQSHYGHKHRMNMSPAARMLGQPHWDASRTNFSERVLDNASSTRVKDTGIRKVTEIQVVQRPQTTSHTTPNKIEVWEGQV